MLLNLLKKAIGQQHNECIEMTKDDNDHKERERSIIVVILNAVFFHLEPQHREKQDTGLNTAIG